MNTIAILFGAELRDTAFEELMPGKSAFLLTLTRVREFEGITKIALLTGDEFNEERIPQSAGPLVLIKKTVWNTKILLDTICELSAGFDLIYFAWADTPLIDAELSRAIKNRIIKYAGEYGYADGWPQGLSPELFLPSTAVFLAKIAEGSQEAVRRDTIFSVIQKDINSFDIETELAPVDLRSYRLLFAADSRRNLLLLRRFLEAGWRDYNDAAPLIAKHPEFLRTLPAFFPIMVCSVCPQKCKFCPYSKNSPAAEFMQPERFSSILDKIIAFSGDAVIDISLWGELALHPARIELIAAVLERPQLSLVIETCGIGWQPGDVEKIAALNAGAKPRLNLMAPVSWIVSLDSASPERYFNLHGEGFEEAAGFAKTLLGAFDKTVYVQALRMRGEEDDAEAFYRFWKDAGAEVIIQKYNNFCASLSDESAGDISPLHRQPCWHIMRDFPIMLDGSVPVCRERQAAGDTEFLAAAGADTTFETAWERGAALYAEHCAGRWSALCERCDEYYTFNF
ncbi:MAG: spiro-SPASM protein [Spirochaetaceae bacterium]|jgi:spiro-SPASM protein|nr:spiro-SPASM protein [Spirochaetaceae bacterium]